MPFTTTNTTIKTFRHALSLDEHRAKFQPNLYHRLTPDASATVADSTAIQEDDPRMASPVSAKTNASFGIQSLEKELKDKIIAETTVHPIPEATECEAPGTAPAVAPSGSNALPEQPIKENAAKRFLRKLLSRKKSTLLPGKAPLRGDNIVNPQNDPADDDIGLTDVKEVWFAGCHSGTPTPLLYHLCLFTLHPQTSAAAPCPTEPDRKSTRLNSSHSGESRMPSSA